MYSSFLNLWVSSVLKEKELLTSYKKYECDSLGVRFKIFLFVFYGMKVNFVLVGVQQVTSKKDQWQYWARKDEPYSFVTVKDFAESFQLFHIGQKLGEELATPFDKSKCHPNALTTKKYGVNKKELLRACASREFLLMKRNSFVYIFKVTQVRNIQSLTLFILSDLKLKFCVSFSSCLFLLDPYSCVDPLFSACLFSCHDNNIISTN